jgi:hypothetical protein
LLIAALTVPASSDETVPRRIDLSGLALITVGIGLFTLTFDRAPSWGWVTPGTIIAFVASVAVLAAFVIVENKVRWPLVDLSLFRNARFTILVVAGTVANIAYTVTVYLDGESATGARTLAVDGGPGVSWPVHWCGARRPDVGQARREVPAGAGDGYCLHRGRAFSGCARSVARLGRLSDRLGRNADSPWGWCMHSPPSRLRRWCGPNARARRRASR